jgi:hypothetical protein
VKGCAIVGCGNAVLDEKLTVFARWPDGLTIFSLPVRVCPSHLVAILGAATHPLAATS